MKSLLLIAAAAAQSHAAQIEPMRLDPVASPLQIHIVNSPALLDRAMPELRMPDLVAEKIRMTAERQLAQGPVVLMNYPEAARSYVMANNMWNSKASSVRWETSKSPVIER